MGKHGNMAISKGVTCGNFAKQDCNRALRYHCLTSHGGKTLRCEGRLRANKSAEVKFHLYSDEYLDAKFKQCKTVVTDNREQEFPLGAVVYTILSAQPLCFSISVLELCSSEASSVKGTSATAFWETRAGT